MGTPWYRHEKIAASLVLAALLLQLVLALILRLNAAAVHDLEINDQYVWLAKLMRQYRETPLQPGELRADDPLRKPPVLPYVLSYFPGASSYLSAQAILSALLLFPIFLLGWRWAGVGAGLLAATLWTLWGPAIDLCHMINQETLYAMFFLAALLLLELTLRHWLYYLPIGLALAAAELTRPVLAPFTVLLLAYLFIRAAKMRFALRLLAPFLALLVGFGAPLAVYHAIRAPFGSTYIYDRKGTTMLTPLVPEGEVLSYLLEHRPANWLTMTAEEQEEYNLDLAWKFVKENPARYVLQALGRVGHFWLFAFGQWNVAVFSPGVLLALLAVLGFLTLRKRDKAAALYAVFLFADFSLMAALIFAKPRFFEVVTPWFLVLVAGGFIAAAKCVALRLRKAKA